MSSKNILIIIGVVIGLIAVAGLVWFMSSQSSSPDDDVDSANQPNNPPAEVFTNVEDCKFVCSIIGYQDGDCRVDDKVEGESEKLSTCVIEGSSQCSQPGSCDCLCWGKSEPVDNGDSVGLANPASVFCEEQGGSLDLREEENGTAGYCLFEDGTECEEWAFFGGECSPQ